MMIDNKSTMQREHWENGKLMSFITATMVKCPPRLLAPEWREPWGTYPDLPHTATLFGQLNELLAQWRDPR